MVGAGKRQQPDLLEPAFREPFAHHLADGRDRALADRAGDHPGLAEPAAPGAAAEDFHAEPLVHRLSDRHQRLARVRPGVEVHHGVLGHGAGYAGPVRRDPADGRVRQVVDVVEARHVDAARGGQAVQQAVPAVRPAGPLPAPDQLGDGQHGLLAVAEHGPVDELGDRLGIERGVPAGQHQRVAGPAVGRGQRDPGEIKRGQQVGVAELGREAHPEHVERAHRPVRVDGELGHVMLAHQRLKVLPDAVGALGEHALAAVEHLVENLDTLVRQAHLVGVRVHQRPPDLGGVPVLDDGVQLAADVLDRLAHEREQPFQLGVDRIGGHSLSVPMRRKPASGRPAGQLKSDGWRRTACSRPIAIMSANMADPP